MRLVDLDLREVGVVGEVGRQALRQPVLHVDAQIRAEVVPDDGLTRQIGREVGDGVRLDVEIQRRGRDFDADQGARCRQPVDRTGPPLRRDLGEVVHFILAANAAADLDAPRLFTRRSVSKRLERNGDLGDPAAFEPGRLCLPNPVPVEVRPVVGARTVAKTAGRRHRKQRPRAAIKERVEQDGDMVLRRHVGAVAAHVVGDDALGVLVPAAAGEIDVPVVEHHPHLGAFGNGRAGLRLLLNEVGKGGDSGVNLLVQPAVEQNRLGDARGADDDAAVLVARSGRGGRLDRCRRGGINRLGGGCCSEKDEEDKEEAEQPLTPAVAARQEIPFHPSQGKDALQGSRGGDAASAPGDYNNTFRLNRPKPSVLLDARKSQARRSPRSSSSWLPPLRNASPGLRPSPDRRSPSA